MGLMGQRWDLSMGKDNRRSARIFTDGQRTSVQIIQEIFPGASWKQCIAIWASSRSTFAHQGSVN